MDDPAAILNAQQALPAAGEPWPETAGAASTAVAAEETASPAALSYPWLLKGRIPSLDGLRAVSIAMVLATHLFQIFLRDHGIGMNEGGRIHELAVIAATLGVQMFFGISGFLITVLLQRESLRTGTFSLKDFYIRRTLRIVPAYVGYLLAMLVLVRLGYLALHAKDWVPALTYTTNWSNSVQWELGHTWSLSLEEQFYLLWPLTLLLLGNRRARHVLIGYLLAAPVFRVCARLLLPAYPALRYSSTLAGMDSIAAGCLLALLATDARARGLLDRASRRPLMGGAAALAVLIGSSLIGAVSPPYQLVIGRGLNALAIAAVIWCFIVAHPTLPGRVLNWGPVAFVGVLSYSLYLWQQLFLNPDSHWRICRWPYNLPLALAAAMASYFIIESPFLRLKSRVHH